MRIRVLAMLVTVVGIFAVAMIFGMGSQRAEATIHEGPIASWCSLLASGNFTPLGPPGISGQSNAGNIAQPLIASGMLLIEFDPVGRDGKGPGVYITPNTDHPAVKVIVDGTYFTIGEGEFLANVEPDPEFPAFNRCPKFFGGP